MPVRPQAGGNSMLWWGNQKPQTAYDPRDINSKEYIPITAAPNKNASESERGAGNIKHRRFLFTGLGLYLASEQTQSVTIQGHTSSSKRTGGQLWCEGDYNMELIPNELIDYYRVIQNAQPDHAAGNGKFTAGTAALAAMRVKDNAQESLPSYVKSSSKDSDGLFSSEPASSDRNFDLNIPSRVKIAMTATAGELILTGFRRIGLPNDEIRPVREVIKTDATGTAYTSSTYWTKGPKVEFKPNADSVTSNPIGAITFDTGTFKSETDGFGDNLSEGVTIMQRIGVVPHVAYDVLFNTFNIEITDGILATCGMIGGPFFARRMIETGAEEKLVIPDDSLWLGDDYPISALLNFQPAWGSLLRFGGKIVNVISGGIGVNLNLESKQYYRASRFRNKPKRSTTPREITATPRVFFESGDEASDIFDRWEDYYVDNTTSEMTLDSYNWLDNGKEYRVKYTIKGMQLVEVPTLSVEDAADIERDLSFLATETPEMKVEFWADEYKE